MIQQVLGEDRWANAMSPDDLRALSPLLYSHVNPYGVFNLDLSTRRAIDERTHAPAGVTIPSTRDASGASYWSGPQ